MKKIVYSYPKSSFLSTEKDMGIIVNTMLKNERLKKLLHYTTKDCLQKDPLTQDESLALFGKNIVIVPKLPNDNSILNYIVIRFDNFQRNEFNPEFRDNIIEFDILCSYDQWHMKDFELRPFKIAAELDTMFDDKHLTGIGTLSFLSANQITTEKKDYAGLCVTYLAIHGEEDKKGMPNPRDEEAFIADYNAMFND